MKPLARTNQAPMNQAPMDQAPMDQAPMDQAPMDQAPMDQAPMSAGLAAAGLPAAGLPSCGAWLRVLLALSCAGAMIASWIPAPTAAVDWAQLTAMIVVVTWAVWRPGSAAAMVLIAAIFAVRVFHGRAVLDGGLVALVLLVPLIHYLAALAAVIPVRSTVRLATLLPTAMRFAGAVLITLVVLLLAGTTGLAA